MEEFKNRLEIAYFFIYKHLKNIKNTVKYI